ncbi:hypothetical protein [Nocardioides pyridinolyticus]
MTRSTRRARALASVALVAGLGLSAAAVTGAPAQSAAPAGDCAVAFPVDELTADDAVTGLTVTRGTTPEGFTGRVLGVLDDGVGPGLDMVMVRLTSPEIDRVGIWQGMSGSPVYAADGRLIGAVGYSLAMGSSTVAGVTPFEQMDDYLAAPEDVAVDGTAARAIARRTDVSLAQARQGFAQLPMPLGVAGVGAARLAQAADRAGDRTWVPRSAYAAGRAGAAAADVTDIVAGGNLAASTAYGDVTMSGVGTVTSVCGDRVVGFGHPAAYLGGTTMALHGADALYVQEDLVAGFKVANLGAPLGTITDDRRAGIAGTLGVLPDTTDISAGLTYAERSRTGVSHVSIDSPDTLALTTFYGLLSNFDAVVDGPVRGTESLAWTITGTDRNGRPFELTREDLYSGGSSLPFRLGFEMGDLVYALAQLSGITLDTVTTTGELTDDQSSYSIAKVEVRQRGQWIEIGRRTTLLARGGQDLAARVTVRGNGATTVLPTTVEVPTNLPRHRGFLQVLGGESAGSGRMPRNVHDVQAWLDGQVRNDQILVTVSRRPQRGGGYLDLILMGRKDADQRQSRVVLGPLDGVVRGSVLAPVFAR